MHPLPAAADGEARADTSTPPYLPLWRCMLPFSPEGEYVPPEKRCPQNSTPREFHEKLNYKPRFSICFGESATTPPFAHHALRNGGNSSLSQAKPLPPRLHTQRRRKTSETTPTPAAARRQEQRQSLCNETNHSRRSAQPSPPPPTPPPHALSLLLSQREEATDKTRESPQEEEIFVTSESETEGIPTCSVSVKRDRQCAPPRMQRQHGEAADGQHSFPQGNPAALWGGASSLSSSGSFQDLLFTGNAEQRRSTSSCSHFSRAPAAAARTHELPL
ncbi:alpha beta fold family domain-containing protein [Cyclospora cayetanensis]|uniref:Alpha beta fold family domain-containing protein n=1 Tax=Cyclospora cayetanensis TaxID=88456 RepID=A0A1D3D3P8_9EIME|nr:alpha beta fold family domain-containing protein [Cyclospora cayetanensis]